MLYRCRGSSLVERGPEKAGVASSILALGTIPSDTVIPEPPAPDPCAKPVGFNFSGTDTFRSCGTMHGSYTGLASVFVGRSVPARLVPHHYFKDRHRYGR